jgi:hypothetical protein
MSVQRGLILTVIINLLFFYSFIDANLWADYGIGSDWPPIGDYMKMPCSKLDFEISLLRKDLINLQKPPHLENPKWREAGNRWGYLISIYSQRCGRFLFETEQLPYEPLDKLPTEKDLMAIGCKAVKGGRDNAAKQMYLMGAEAGYPEAQYKLGYYYLLEGNSAEAKRWWRKSALQGSEKAQEALRQIQSGENADLLFRLLLELCK